MPAPKKILKTIVRFDHTPFVFDSLSAAADAIKFFGKLKRVELTENGDGTGYHYAPHEKSCSIDLDTEREFRATPQRLALPAPKRGTVPCENCESVSVRPGSACGSCGTISPIS